MIRHLAQNNLINIPADTLQNIVLECVVSSQMYRTATDSSDTDLLGVYMPSHEQLFPKQIDNIPGFHLPTKPPKIYSKDHITLHGYTYDVKLVPLPHFFHLLNKGCHRSIECLYSPMVEHSTPIGSLLRKRRNTLLNVPQIVRSHKGVIDSTRSYLDKAIQGGPFDSKTASKKLALAYTVLGNLLEILETGTLDITKNKFLSKVWQIKRKEIPEYVAPEYLYRLNVAVDEIDNYTVQDKNDIEYTLKFIVALQMFGLEYQ